MNSLGVRSAVLLHEYVEGQGHSLYSEGVGYMISGMPCCSETGLDVKSFETPFSGGLWSSHGKFLSGNLHWRVLKIACREAIITSLKRTCCGDDEGGFLSLLPIQLGSNQSN